MKIFIYILFLQFIGVALIAQSASEVLKYNLARPYGTARAMGCGEAMGALGGDFTAISINPAGIGVYRKSDFYISTYANFDEQQSMLTNPNGIANPTYSQTRDAFRLGGIGMVFTSEPIASNWKNLNFAINVIRTADFAKSYYFKGRSVGSITDRFLELSLDPHQSGLIGLDPNQLDNFEAGLAYETGAVYDPRPDSLRTNNIYTTDLFNFNKGYSLPKQQLLKTSGGLYNLSFGFGGNYDDKLFIGASLDIPIGTFRSESQYLEYEAQPGDLIAFRNLQFIENLQTDISGIGGKLGVIYKPTQYLRLGLSWQTPTYLWLHDYYNTSLTNTFNTGRQDTSLTSYSPDGEFTYRLTIPMKIVLSAAYINQRGFISADVDFLNVSQSKYNLTADSDAASDYDYQQTLNSDIKKQFKSVIQIRFGGELNLGNFRLRAGLQFLQQAFANIDKFDKGFSLGLGWRRNRFYVDLAYKHFASDQTYSPYRTANSDFDGNGTVDAPTQLVNQKSFQDQIQLTFGFKL